MDREGLAEPAQGQTKGLSPASASPNNRDTSLGPGKRERLPCRIRLPLWSRGGGREREGENPGRGNRPLAPTYIYEAAASPRTRPT